jgi:hypothetical protein
MERNRRMSMEVRAWICIVHTSQNKTAVDIGVDISGLDVRRLLSQRIFTYSIYDELEIVFS